MKEVRFNIPEQLQGNIINQKIARAFLKKKTTGLMDEEVDLGGLRTLVWDCHNPVFWGSSGKNGVMERAREENMTANFGNCVELFGLVEGLREIRVVLDWRKGSKVWEYVKGLEFNGLRLVDDGVGSGEEEGQGYRLRTLRFVA